MSACRDCCRTMTPGRRRPPTGMVRYGANGRCQPCDAQLIRALSRGKKYEGGRDTVVPVHAKECDSWPARA